MHLSGFCCATKDNNHNGRWMVAQFSCLQVATREHQFKFGFQFKLLAPLAMFIRRRHSFLLLSAVCCLLIANCSLLTRVRRKRHAKKMSALKHLYNACLFVCLFVFSLVCLLTNVASSNCAMSFNSFVTKPNNNNNNQHSSELVIILPIACVVFQGKHKAAFSI